MDAATIMIKNREELFKTKDTSSLYLFKFVVLE